MSSRATSSRSGSGKRDVVAIGGIQDHDHQVATADRLAAQLDVRRGPAVERTLDRAFEAKDLLDRGRDQARILSHEGELFGVGEQVDDCVADQTDGRLVPGDDQQDDHPEDLLLGKGVALVSGGEQRADEVIGGCGPPCREELARDRRRTRPSARRNVRAPPDRARASRSRPSRRGSGLGPLTARRAARQSR